MPYQKYLTCRKRPFCVISKNPVMIISQISLRPCSEVLCATSIYKSGWYLSWLFDLLHDIYLHSHSHQYLQKRIFTVCNFTRVIRIQLEVPFANAELSLLHSKKIEWEGLRVDRTQHEVDYEAFGYSSSRKEKCTRKIVSIPNYSSNRSAVLTIFWPRL